MKAIIIEDEERSRMVLQNLLESYCPEVAVAGSADSVTSGVQTIHAHHPDVIFLDVHISGGTGFDVLEQMEDLNASVIFTTAYDDYALKAFKFSAVDYLLKPIDIEELKSAVGKAIRTRKEKNRGHQLRNLLTFFRNPNEDPVLLVTAPEAVEDVHMPNIIRCAAHTEHTVLHIKGNRKLTVDKPIKDVEFLLRDYGFFRVHPEHIVNMREVRKTNRAWDVVILKDGTEVPLSSGRREEYAEAARKFSE